MKELNSKARKEFKKKYHKDTLLGRSVASKISGKEISNNGSLIKSSPGDRNITPLWIPGKGLIESKAKEKRDEDYQHYLHDALEVRKLEILDKKDVPMVSLLQMISRNIPQKLESKNEHTFTFADMVKRATIELQKIDTVDAV